MEPWLDSLSEDWDSQPRSSPPASVPKSTPDGAIRGVTRPPQSKIPRPRSSSKPYNSSSPLGGQSASLKRTKILTERSSSEVNVPRHPSTHSVEAKIPSSLRLSRSSSAGSVVRKSSPPTTQRKSRSASPPKQSKSQTPEWKRLVMGDGKGVTPKSDLFTPIGLESIFVKPAEELAPPSPEMQHESSTLQDSENIPSSPPPLPSNYLVSHIRNASSKRWDAYQTLEVVVEQDETGSERLSQPASECEIGTQTRSEGQMKENEQIEPSIPRYRLGKQEMSGRQASHDTTDYSQRPLADDCRSKHLGSSDISQTKSDSSVSSGLSPVYISKHNTIGGGVNYAALDMSNPETMMQLKQASLHNESQNRSSSWQTAIKDESSNDMQCTTPEHQVDVAPISGFVSVERGGHSDDGSFRRRPLSPSMPLSDLPSESLAPSDSASQVDNQFNRGVRNSGLEHNNESERTDMQQIHEPGTVQATLAYRESSDPLAIQKTASTSSPLKLFGDHDTFTNDQLLRRIGQLDISGLETIAHRLTCKMRDRGNNVTENQVYREILKSARQPSVLSEDATEGNVSKTLENHFVDGMQGEGDGDSEVIEDNMYSQHQELALSKRSPPTPIDHSIPKRQRTICRLDAIPDTPQGPATGEDQNRLAISLIGRKRKDARNGGNREVCGPDELAKRPILRPRQSSSAGYQPAACHQEITSESFLEGESRLDTIQRHLETIDFSANQNNDVDIKELVSEITNSPTTAHMDFDGSIRKHSVSTQDYLTEAMKIMEVIRSTRKPESELSTFQQSVAEEMTPQTISRPPSREGPAIAWRDQNREPLAEDVLVHLKQFAEIGDESFAVSSAIKSLHLREDEISGDDNEGSFESERHDVRILDQHLVETKDIDDQESEAWKENSEHQQIKTHSSQGSTDSTGRTFKTNSSQKTRNVATIPLDKVSHLIQTEQAGMRFDAEKHTWVRCKAERSPDRMLENISSSAGTEDDPFGDIPDLDVDEIGEGHGSHLFETTGGSQSDTEIRSYRIENLSDGSLLQTIETSTGRHDDNSNDKDHVIISDQRDENSRVTTAKEQLVHQQSGFIYEDDNDRTESSSHTPINTPPIHSARKQSLMIRSSMGSSPSRGLSNDFNSSQMSLQPYNNWFSDFKGDTRRRHTTPGQTTSAGDNHDHQMALSCIDEHQEISFIETRPDGRSFSLTLSMSTPMPSSDRRASFARSNALRSGRRFFSLSPLSEFTIHQDDHRHLQSRNLLGGSNTIQIQGNHAQSSTTVTKLVDKLMETHLEDDMDWDMTKSLTLHEKSLDSLLMLDEFCPKLEYLDASWNDLRHIEGIPSMVRQLDVRQNLLSSLTDWSHLKNLQYLDVSGNEIDSLEALSCLVHLRELKADDNCIMDFQGLLDLDGLLQLSMRRNQLQYVGLHGANMWRLAKLDLRDNSIEEVDGLSSLPCLEELYLSNNSLEHFAGPGEAHEKDTMELHSLWIDNNELEELDVSAFPTLRFLVADNNILSRVKGMTSLSNIDTVSLRSQRYIHKKGDGLATHFNDFAEVRHLYVSDNNIPYLDMTSSFLNLQTLEIAMTGLKYFPKNFGLLAPNLRTLNANSNSLRDLYPLNGILRLKALLVAGNRIRRLRDTALKINQISELQELDLRGNPFCARFYALVRPNLTAERSLIRVQSESPQDATPTKGAGRQDLQHILPPADKKQDNKFSRKLEDDARFRRKIYELLLATRCHNLAKLDGLGFELGLVLKRDSVWRHLTSRGCIEKSMVAAAE